MLRKYYSGAWYNLANKYAGPVGGNRYLYASVRYRCTATPLRAWEARADAYAFMAGVWYGGTYSNYKNLYCG